MNLKEFGKEYRFRRAMMLRERRRIRKEHRYLKQQLKQLPWVMLFVIVSMIAVQFVNI